MSQVVFPKSDAQRQALADSVKDILLFRSLDKVSIVIFVLYYILDALKIVETGFL